MATDRVAFKYDPCGSSLAKEAEAAISKRPPTGNLESKTETKETTRKP